ncbi:hypothetical protein BS333_18070 [Vibrio azureus]|uniref:Uncharacterized protein n=1 Tax=Vibrio azureus NBRC 104587 TaxID=1219077 RepID=U3AUH5_9VIBR|nr:hypothetical protein [Vibrio azureus]AUI88252.1 hypothetical protein BS333_18070 [Vibrio azureus]GAD77405.1 hypothetical protein VAZ01S_074_00040 [Vibrio azureus NBRC 104587]
MRNFLTFITASCISFYSYSWTSEISKIQAEGIKDPYNAIYFKKPITDSACEKTNKENRMVLVNEVQHSTALAALMANKVVQVQGSGVCNGVGLEEINYVMIFSDK